jgi:hypothetical protein
MGKHFGIMRFTEMKKERNHFKISCFWGVLLVFLLVPVIPAVSATTNNSTTLVTASQNATPYSIQWIQINPIPDHFVPPDEQENYTGNFFINGTTNLVPGQEINVDMSNGDMPPCPKNCWDIPTRVFYPCACGINATYSGTTKVIGNPDGNNTWSFFVNTSPRVIGPAINDFNDIWVIVTSDNVQVDSGFCIHFVTHPVKTVPSNTTISVVSRATLSPVTPRTEVSALTPGAAQSLPSPTQSPLSPLTGVVGIGMGSFIVLTIRRKK